MKHLLDFVFLAILVDVMLRNASWNRQTLRWRFTLLGVYIAAAIVLWMVGHWFLIPMQFENLFPQVYIFTVLGLFGVVRLTSGERLWGSLGQEPDPLLVGIGVLTLLGVPLHPYAGQMSMVNYLLPTAAAGTGWLAISYVISTLGEELRVEGVPRLLCGRGGLLIIAGLLYWALMGFFNVHFM
mgnify:CR=1 FL=1|jgi:Na+-translocating ferredoxin:NAD+ oxidoreductase RnfA subunit|tara:strand:+ start:3461 stop:4009 length:549 start_codon:yes stop_codon:yes gene_type:complete